MATEKLGFTNREDRDAKIRQLRAAGLRHINKYTTHEGKDPRIIYVLTWDEPPVTVAQEKTNEDSESVSAVS